MAIADYLNKLVQLKNDLITTLRNKGVEVSDDEKLNTLVPKVNEVEGKQNVEWVDDTSGMKLKGCIETYYHKYSNILEFVKHINLPEDMAEIGTYAFYDCESLTSIKIPDSVTSIGDYAFSSCSSLTSVIIGDGVTSIGKNAFSSCTSLEHIYYTGTKEQWNAISKGASWNYNMGKNVTGGTVIHYNYVP